jgi:hypothetical protein
MGRRAWDHGGREARLYSAVSIAPGSPFRFELLFSLEPAPLPLRMCIAATCTVNQMGLSAIVSSTLLHCPTPISGPRLTNWEFRHTHRTQQQPNIMPSTFRFASEKCLCGNNFHYIARREPPDGPPRHRP